MSSANSEFYFFFSNLDSFYSFFLLLLLWLKLPKLCWIVVVRVGTLVLFLILEEMLSMFCHWGKCLLWVCRIWLLLCWDMFLLCLLSGEFLSQIGVEFCQRLSLHLLVFIFQFVNMVYHIDWFVNIEESLHPWDKAHLVMVYDLFNVLLDSDC